MQFKDFCQGFYTGQGKTGGLKRVTSQSGIVEYLLTIALNDYESQQLIYTDDWFRKVFTGDRHVSEDLYVLMEEKFDEMRFAFELRNKLNDSTLSVVMGNFGIHVTRAEEPNKYVFAAALAAQFHLLITKHGEAEMIVATMYQEKLEHAIEFPQYVENTREKYSTLKTLLYTSEAKPFYDFFVCNTIWPQYIIGKGRRKKNRKSLLEDVTPERLLKYARYVLLVGMGGIGKSMMMRHLFLTALETYGKTGLLPILITLREFATEQSEKLTDLVLHTVQRFDDSISEERLYKMLRMGSCLILLDGYDEIKYSELERFQHELEVFVDRYAANQFVMSSREMSAFLEIPRFSLMGMMPFTKEQSLELVRKLDFCEDEPKLKEKFLEQLDGDLFEKQEEFATNPLLLTLMLMNYRRFGGVPEKMHLFYAEAYDTLLMRHDADKIAYRRVFHSVNDPADFTTVFREFCAKSYRRGDFEFDRKSFEAYFGKLKSITRLDKSKMKMENFLFDALHSVCLMYEESQSYHFLHRSFQEYFFADYYSRQDDTTLRKLGESLENNGTGRHRGKGFGDMALSMLHDLAPEKVEQFIILPFLDKIWGDENIDEDAKFWKFMYTAYGGFFFYVINDAFKGQYEAKENTFTDFNGCVVSSIIYELISKLNELRPVIVYPDSVDQFADQSLISDVLVEQQIGKNSSQPMLLPLPIRILDSGSENNGKKYEGLLYDAKGNSLVRGYRYRFHFGSIFEGNAKNTPLMEALAREDSKFKKVYNKIKQYYMWLRQESVQKADDDDF